MNIRNIFPRQLQYVNTAVVFLLVTGFLSTQSCRESHTPRPRGYFRIDLPEHSYLSWRSDCPFYFEYPVYTKLSPDDQPGSEPCWLNIDYPAFRGRLHISYKQVDNNLMSLAEDARKLAYKHSIKADAIAEQMYVNEEKKVFGVLYDIKGDAASSLQFYLTDSIQHFLRGALYFHLIPNPDSLAPVIRFCREDIVHLIESFEWQND